MLAFVEDSDEQWFKMPALRDGEVELVGRDEAGAESMRIGVVFPQTELGGDPGACAAFAVAASELGYAHIAVFDHVVGADPRGPPRLERPLRRPHHLP